MNKPKYEIGDRLPGSCGIVIDVYQPHGHTHLVYTIAFGDNLLTILGCDISRLFPLA